ncbi:metal ABC transporter permease [Leucobacter celer]|uniref:metal ABC transporter permease n=1 Tax=Leucobacter celer TaxID=668625 RepID=UPI000AD1666A|nr:metal ABC transporter permease [Leucobacter celer]
MAGGLGLAALDAIAGSAAAGAAAAGSGPLAAAFGPLEVFALPFMSRALLTVAILALAAGVVGLFISFRELEFVSDGLVHAVFPGLVVGAAIGGTAAVLPGAAVAAVLAAVLFTVIERRGGIGADAAIAVVLTGLFSLGVVLVSRQEGYVSQLQELLFGRLLTVTEAQLWQILVVAIAAILVVALTWRAQLFRAFDAAGAEAAGFRPLAADLALGIAVALLVVAGVQALGVLMVIALLTVPMAAARLLTRGFALLIPIAILLPLLAGVLGLWLSFEWSVGAGATVSPGAVVVLLLVGFYVLAALVRVTVLRLSPASRTIPGAAIRDTGESRDTARGSRTAAGSEERGTPGACA